MNQSNWNSRTWDLIIVGSGPNGLATALHARQRSLDALVLERGQIAENIAQFPKQLVLFGLSGDQEIAAVPCDCPRGHPTREEFLSYLLRVVDLTGLAVCERTAFCGLDGEDGRFEVRALRNGNHHTFLARKVVLATGVYGQPNQLTVPGADLAKVVYSYGDPYDYRHQRVVVVGAGQGAAEAALRLYTEANAEVTVLNRASELNPRRWRWKFPDITELIAHGKIRLLHNTIIERVEATQVVVSSPAGLEKIPNDHVIVQMGYRPDTALFASSGVEYDALAAPRISPRTLETNVKGVYVAGNAVTGASDFILIRGGRNHGKVIVADILGDAPMVEDLGVDSPEHWLQFERLDDSLDSRLALDLVPVVVGHFPHQLLDVYQAAFTRHLDRLEAQGVRRGDMWKHSFCPGSTIDELGEEHIEAQDDGSVFFKGQVFPVDALEILRRADGTRRIRDIVAEIEALYQDRKKRLPAAMVVEFLLDLLRIGKLTWRPAPLAATQARA